MTAVWVSRSNLNHCPTSNISCTLVDNKIIDHSDGQQRRSALLQYIFNLKSGFNGLGKDKCKTRWETFEFWNLVSYIRDLKVDPENIAAIAYGNS